ncbi:hypothetical protein [Streptomyces sp. NBC_00829]|uniref:hypothetical protein n=1 Tax=Streptomyces sp. NBC_00829 TaxID=2903679 RepID=UPI00386E5ECA|nr:hypothetical protein OG293_29145 [Streptomyces sp. NBC_00829]
MQTIRDRPPAPGTDLLTVLAGAAFAVSGVGVGLALTGVQSPLRAPFILFFLFAGPACALAAALPRLDPAARAAVAAAGAVVIDLLIAQLLSSSHALTTGQGITAVAVITGLLFLGSPALRKRNPEHIDPASRLMKGIKGIRSSRSVTDHRIGIKKAKK